jgi:hypothetical protein
MQNTDPPRGGKPTVTVGAFPEMIRYAEHRTVNLLTSRGRHAKFPSASRASLSSLLNI